MGGANGLAKGIPARLTAAEGRRFGLTVGGAFLLLAAVARWRGREVPEYAFGSLAALLIAAGVLLPARLGPVNRAWMGLAHAISKVTTPLFMSIVYFVILMPVGLLMRAMGRNPVRHRPVNQSYWMKRTDAHGTMTNQF